MVRAVVVALTCSLLVTDSIDAAACAPAPPEGQEVRIAEEEAIILWDPATRTEHFIRKARFQSTSRAFGFLVPTPTTPQLGEVSDSAFWSMADRIKPEVRYERETKLRISPLMLEACNSTMMSKGGDMETSGAPTASAVRVIATAHVAGFDATTLEADDAGALAAWLDARGFATTPALTAWLARYVSQKWQLTAFVVATDERDPRPQYELATRAVRMSFQTDRPFYPYREPGAEAAPATPSREPEGPGSRILRVHFLSTERHAATLAGAPWSARVPFAAPIGAPLAELAGLGDHLRHATVFVDESYPRRGIDEVYFAPSADRAEVRPPVIVIQEPDVILIPAELVGLALAGVVLLVRWRIRRRRRAAAG